jgi:hypothetical protein
MLPIQKKPSSASRMTACLKASVATTIMEETVFENTFRSATLSFDASRVLAGSTCSFSSADIASARTILEVWVTEQELRQLLGSSDSILAQQ